MEAWKRKEYQLKQNNEPDANTATERKKERKTDGTIEQHNGGWKLSEGMETNRDYYKTKNRK